MMMDSFQRKLNEVKRVIDDDNYRRRVLTLCQQSEPKSFDEYSSSGSFRQLEKFESSTYSEVLKAVDLADNNKPVVMKIMRALSKAVLKLVPSLTGKGCQSYNDIFNELVVTQALSQLHEGVLLGGRASSLYKTHFFCFIHEIRVVSGSMEKTLSKSKQKEQALAPEDNQASETKRVSSARAGSPTVKDDRLTEVAPGNDGGSVDSERQAPSFAGAKKQYERDQMRHGVAEICERPPDGHHGEINDEMDQGIAAAKKSCGPKKGDEKQAKNPSVGQESSQDEDELIENERMLVAALPQEYVVSVMRHDGHPLWWWMTHKKLTPEQLTSVLVQVIVGLAIAEHVYSYEHRDLHVSNILIKRTSTEAIPFVVEGHHHQVISHGIKATIIDATFSRLTHNGKVYFRDLTSTLRAYGAKKTPPRMSLQNRSYRQMVRLTRNKWDEFKPRTNLIWLTYLCETIMKNEVMKGSHVLTNELKKIRDYTVRVKTTMELLRCFPFEKMKSKGCSKGNSKGSR